VLSSLASHYRINSDNAVKDAVIPAFPRLVNFSQHSPMTNGNKVCVMCGHSRLVKKREGTDGTTPFIPFGNKGVCSECEATSWLEVKKKIQIKWCRQGVHFRPLATFMGKRTHAGKHPTVLQSCSACRDLSAAYKHDMG